MQYIELFMKKKLFNINVLQRYHNIRLDKFLQLNLDKLSRNRIQNLIYEGCIKINSTNLSYNNLFSQLGIFVIEK